MLRRISASTPPRRAGDARLQRAIVLVALVASAAPLGAQAPCDTTVSRTTLSTMSGRRIGAVDVQTLDPDPLPGAAAALDWIHVRTRDATVRRQLLFAPGDTVDTLRIGESLRRLRHLHYLVDVAVRGTSCSPDVPVHLTVVTRDDWSTKPSIRVRSASSSALGLTERNLFGSGREASVDVSTDAGRVGLGAHWRDPWVAGGRLALDVGANSYRDGNALSAALSRREQTVFDPWGFDATIERAVRDAAAENGDVFRRTSASALGSRRIGISRWAVTSLVGGVEYENAGLIAGRSASIVGPHEVRREFSGLDIGLARRSVAYDTVTWLLAANGIADVPLAREADAVIGVGRERVAAGTAIHADLWAGQMWLPNPRTLVVADLWSSGYLAGGRVSAATARASVAVFRPAAGGTWIGRLALEQLLAPDPDVRSLAWSDPTLAALPSSARLAHAAVGGSLERTLRVHSLSRSWAIEAAGFAAFSDRRDPADSSGEHVYAGILGAGLRLAPTKLGRGTARLDIGFPVVGSGNVSRRPFIAISVMPWLEQARHRDGRTDR
jgi:hypothetical protein